MSQEDALTTAQSLRNQRDPRRICAARNPKFN
jgi:hypothetical protein